MHLNSTKNINLKKKTRLSTLTTTSKIESMAYFYLQNGHRKLQNQRPKQYLLRQNFAL